MRPQSSCLGLYAGYPTLDSLALRPTFEQFALQVLTNETPRRFPTGANEIPRGNPYKDSNVSSGVTGNLCFRDLDLAVVSYRCGGKDR